MILTCVAVAASAIMALLDPREAAPLYYCRMTNWVIAVVLGAESHVIDVPVPTVAYATVMKSVKGLMRHT